ncbi:transglutaminase-like superfamily protein [Clostridium homopropionicum DSM 5847]|uniref:Transglutaminase-like superfamily protein n=1 Tax=Clostridium homopropionicum DSM 5847 TaxID=1121318 RepID=A0A0L6Z8Z6_9CLOT|nr:Ig-like domain-containing protein [Clostridium homopropionicum]KOA19440.1 transglutaminase-like superfamily protein [Clostridium homopropionicum DSM 5847]SFG69756.1 Transglutaminase-like superfamily protein [Clostridium homopropionicum]
MYKKYIKIFFVFVFLFLKAQTIFALDSNYKVWESKYNVSVDKIWNIRFNKSVDMSTIKDNIKVIEKDNEIEVSVETLYTDNDNSIIVKPRENYKYDTEYIMIINDNIKSVTNKNLSQPVSFRFTTEKSESLLKENYVDPGSVANSTKDFKDIIIYALANFKNEVSIEIPSFNTKDYKLDVINDILLENPLLDYGYKGANGSIYTNNLSKSATMIINLDYEYSKEYMEKMKKTVEDKSKEIISKIIKNEMTEKEKELAIHNFIVNNSKYDSRLFSGNMPNESYLDYGILINGVGVCDSYAKAMYRLLNTAGIECIYVAGDAYNGNEIIPHAWNIVNIEGKLYHVDATWDDPISNDGRDILSFDYFNISDNIISKDHIWDREKYPKCLE